MPQMRRFAITGNLSRGRQTNFPPARARVPLVKATPSVTPKSLGNIMTNRGTSTKKANGKTTQLAKATTSKFH